MIRRKLFSHISLAKKSLLGCNCVCHQSSNSSGASAKPDFNPRRALILTKVSRYEYERFRHPADMSETEFELTLKKRGSDYAMIRYV
jgi:hypothetical protein